MRMMSAPGWWTFGRRILDKTFSCTLGPRIGVFRSVAMVSAATWNQRKSANSYSTSRMQVRLTGANGRQNRS